MGFGPLDIRKEFAFWNSRARNRQVSGKQNMRREPQFMVCDALAPVRGSPWIHGHSARVPVLIPPQPHRPMKTNLLYLAGGRVSSLIAISGAILSLVPGIAFGEFNASDPLTRDSGNWSRSSPNTTSMVFQNSRLEVLVKAPVKNKYSFLTWTSNSGSFREDWFIQADIHIDMISLPNGSGVVLGVGTMNLNDPASDMAYVGFAREQSGGYSLGMLLVNECGRTKAHDHAITTRQNATVRLHFDSQANTLTGSWNTGPGWQYARPLPVKSWGIGRFDECVAFLVAGNFGNTNKGVNVRSGEAYFTNFVAGAVSPEITVEQPVASNLKDGKAKRSFGTVSIRNGAKTMVFVIRNDGTTKLTNLAITRDGINAADFTLSKPAATSLDPGQSTTFRVTFKPQAKGTRSAAIHITSNDADESPFDVSLTGLGVK